MSELGRANDGGGTGAQVLDREVEDFAEIFTTHRQAVYNVALTGCRDEDVASDLTQSVFARAFEHRAELRDPDRVKAWLLISAANFARMHRRATRVTASMEVLMHRPAPGPLLEEAVATQEAADLVWEAAGSLDAHHRLALDLRVRHGLNASEVGIALGMSPSQASALITRTGEALKTAVRALLVRRRGHECPRLGVLVAEAGDEFTQTQRRSVDRHMRKCTACRGVADRLTRPAELFGGLMLLPVPAGLERFDPSWLRRSHPPGSMPSMRTVARATARGGLRTVLGTPLGLGSAAAVAVLGIGAAVIATTNHGGKPAPHAAAASTPVASVSAPTPTPVLATIAPTPAAPPPDESTKTADAIFADTLTDIRSASSYHVGYTTTANDGDSAGFEMAFTPTGYSGTITLIPGPRIPLDVQRVAGVTYVAGPSVRAQPDTFGLSSGQAAQLGDAWLALATSGPQADTATLVDRAVAPFSTGNSLADLASPNGVTHVTGVTMLGAQQVIVLTDQTGSMYVTDAPQPYPVKIVGALDTVQLRDFNAVAPVTAPSSVQRIPSS